MREELNPYFNLHGPHYSICLKMKKKLCKIYREILLMKQCVKFKAFDCYVSAAQKLWKCFQASLIMLKFNACKF